MASPPRGAVRGLAAGDEDAAVRRDESRRGGRAADVDAEEGSASASPGAPIERRYPAIT